MLEYEFETVSCDEGDGGYSLFGGIGMETLRHQEVICQRAVDGWRYVGFIPSVDKGQYGFSGHLRQLAALSSLPGGSPAASSALPAARSAPEKLRGTCQ